MQTNYPDSKVRGVNVGHTGVLSAPGEPHVGPMDLAIRVYMGHGIGYTIEYSQYV